MSELLTAYLQKKGVTVSEERKLARAEKAARLAEAKADNKLYLAQPAPTAKQQAAQIVKLTRQNNRIISFILSDMTSED